MLRRWCEPGAAVSMDVMNTVSSSSPPLRIDWEDASPAGGPAGRTMHGAGGAGRVTLRPRTGLTSPASWRELVYAVVDLAPAIFFFAALVTLLTAGAGLTVVYVGIPVMMLALLLARLGGAVQIGLARSLLDLPVALPGPFRRSRPGFAGMIGAVLADGAAWRAVVYFLIKIVLAPVTFTVAVALYSWGLGAVTYPAWRPFLPAQLGGDRMWHRGAQLWNGYFVDTWPAMAAFAAVGLLVLLAAPHVLRWFVTADRLLIAGLLGRR
jgi:hypothetical protein